MQVNMHEAKTHLSRLVAQVEAGAEVVIARDGKAVAKLVPYQAPKPRVWGLGRGLYEVPEDFDAPLPDEILDDFER